MPGTGLIVLAAGESSRFGTPKQLLCLEGKTLIRRAVEIALGSACEPVVVVLGAYAELVQQELEKLNVLCAVNSEWQSGMGSSIRVGMAALLSSSPEIDSVCIILCDQPFLTSEVIDQLVCTQRETASVLAASDYGEGARVPAIFHRSLFSELQALSGEEGAKEILLRHKPQISLVSFQMGLFDVDTLEDWENLHLMYKPSDGK